MNSKKLKNYATSIAYTTACVVSTFDVNQGLTNLVVFLVWLFLLLSFLFQLEPIKVELRKSVEKNPEIRNGSTSKSFQYTSGWIIILSFATAGWFVTAGAAFLSLINNSILFKIVHGEEK